MFNIKSFFVVLMAIIFPLTGCKNDTIVTSVQNKQLSKIIQDDDNYSTFNYLNGKLVIYQTISGAEIFLSVILNYDNSDLPQSEHYKTRNEDILKNYYFNQSSMLDSMDFLLYSNTTYNYVIDGHMKYSYNASNHLIKMEQYNTGYELLFTTEYDYDASENIVESRFYNMNGLLEIAKMTYDNKTNPLYHLKGLLNYEATMSKNNLVSTSTTNVNNSQNNSETIITYKYSSDGYPVTRTIDYIGYNNKSTLSYTYEYQ